MELLIALAALIAFCVLAMRFGQDTPRADALDVAWATLNECPLQISRK